MQAHEMFIDGLICRDELLSSEHRIAAARDVTGYRSVIQHMCLKSSPKQFAACSRIKLLCDRKVVLMVCEKLGHDSSRVFSLENSLNIPAAGQRC